MYKSPGNVLRLTYAKLVLDLLFSCISVLDAIPEKGMWRDGGANCLIKLVSTKFGQIHCTFTPVVAKLILFCE